MINLSVGTTVLLDTGRTFVVEDDDQYYYIDRTAKLLLDKSIGICYDSYGNHVGMYTQASWSGIVPFDFKDPVKLTNKKQELLCDCGGHKVYNTMAKEFHSHWCKVNRGA